MPRTPRRRRPYRDALIVAAALYAAHSFGRDVVERGRIEMLRLYLEPAAIVRDLFAEPIPFPPPDAAAEIRRDARARLFASDRRAALPVVAHRPSDGRIVVGAGRDAGVVLGAAVFAAEGLLGHVDRVEGHLARVRLISARGARTAVLAAEARPDLPGGLDRMSAVLEGDGIDGVLVDAAPAESFRLGEPVVAPAFESAPVGEIVSVGVRPRIRLFAQADRAGAVAVQGVGFTAALAATFEDEPLALVASPAAGGRGALFRGAAVARLLPGAALHASGFYIGRIEGAARSSATATLRDDAGHRIGVRLVRGVSERGAVLRAEGRGAFTVVAGAVPEGEDSEPVVAYTSGGGGLVPPDLKVGSFKIEGALLRDVEGVRRPPPIVQASVFVFAEELARLRGAGR